MRLAPLFCLLLFALPVVINAIEICPPDKLPTEIKISHVRRPLNIATGIGSNSITVTILLEAVNRENGQRTPLANRNILLEITILDKFLARSSENRLSLSDTQSPFMVVTNEKGMFNITLPLDELLRQRTDPRKITYSITASFTPGTREPFLGSTKTVRYTPGSFPLISVEACFPLILVFALLAAAMFASGQNPFGLLDFSRVAFRAPQISRRAVKGVTVRAPPVFEAAFKSLAGTAIRGAYRMAGGALSIAGNKMMSGGKGMAKAGASAFGGKAAGGAGGKAAGTAAGGKAAGAGKVGLGGLIMGIGGALSLAGNAAWRRGGSVKGRPSQKEREAIAARRGAGKPGPDKAPTTWAGIKTSFKEGARMAWHDLKQSTKEGLLGGGLTGGFRLWSISNQSVTYMGFVGNRYLTEKDKVSALNRMFDENKIPEKEREKYVDNGKLTAAGQQLFTRSGTLIDKIRYTDAEKANALPQFVAGRIMSGDASLIGKDGKLTKEGEKRLAEEMDKYVQDGKLTKAGNALFNDNFNDVKLDVGKLMAPKTGSSTEMADATIAGVLNPGNSGVINDYASRLQNDLNTLGKDGSIVSDLMNGNPEGVNRRLAALSEDEQWIKREVGVLGTMIGSRYEPTSSGMEQSRMSEMTRPDVAQTAAGSWVNELSYEKKIEIYREHYAHLHGGPLPDESELTRRLTTGIEASIANGTKNYDVEQKKIETNEASIKQLDSFVDANRGRPETGRMTTTIDGREVTLEDAKAQLKDLIRENAELQRYSGIGQETASVLGKDFNSFKKEVDRAEVARDLASNVDTVYASDGAVHAARNVGFFDAYSEAVKEESKSASKKADGEAENLGNTVGSQYMYEKWKEFKEQSAGMDNEEKRKFAESVATGIVGDQYKNIKGDLPQMNETERSALERQMSSALMSYDSEKQFDKQFKESIKAVGEAYTGAAAGLYGVQDANNAERILDTLKHLDKTEGSRVSDISWSSIAEERATLDNRGMSQEVKRTMAERIHNENEEYRNAWDNGMKHERDLSPRPREYTEEKRLYKISVTPKTGE